MVRLHLLFFVVLGLRVFLQGAQVWARKLPTIGSRSSWNAQDNLWVRILVTRQLAKVVNGRVDSIAALLGALNLRQAGCTAITD